jgi:Zn-dependent protease with chaperone function
LTPGPSRTAIEETFQQVGVAVGEILVWPARGGSANAAICGALPQLRYLFVTDGLLARFGAQDLRAIAAHEAAHCQRGHLRELASSLLLPLTLLAIVDVSLASWGKAGLPLLVLAVLGGWSIWHGYWARLLEHDADLAACRQLSGGERVTSESVASFTRALAATGAGQSGDWLHPATGRRIDRLWQFADDPRGAERFALRVQWIGRSQSLLALGLLVLWMCLA